jgi:hypothetical protein
MAFLLVFFREFVVVYDCKFQIQGFIVADENNLICRFALERGAM